MYLFSPNRPSGQIPSTIRHVRVFVCVRWQTFFCAVIVPPGLIEKFQLSSLIFFLNNFLVFFGEAIYCSAELHYTGGVHCIALHWHVTGDKLTCEMWPPLPFVRPDVRPFVRTSVCPSVRLPLPKKSLILVFGLISASVKRFGISRMR